jgi:cytochrome c-type biogenesis protein CcsB
MLTGLLAVLFWSCLVLYAVAVATQFYGQIFRNPGWIRIATYAVWLGFALHTICVAWRWIETGHVPTIGDFENALMGSWFIVLMTVWAGWKERYPMLAAGTLPLALLILGFGASSDATPRPMLASLRSSWLYIHIFFAWLAYGAYTVACGAAVVYLVRSKPKRLTPKEVLGRTEELMFRSTVFGFITDTIMIAAGSIWAKNLWGSYWSWDPVETWSLLSWLVYGVIIHLHITLRWGGRRLAWLLVIAIIGVLVSFWGVNLVMEGTDHFFNVE